MKIVSLSPFITEMLSYFGLGESIVGVTHRCNIENLVNPAVVTTARDSKTETGIRGYLSVDLPELDKIIGLTPDIILTSLNVQDWEDPRLNSYKTDLSIVFDKTPVKAYNPFTLEGVFTFFEELGRDLKVPDKGLSLSHRVKAQAMDWCDNFYDRMKNKRVTFISSIEPLMLAGYWIPDLIHLCSAGSQNSYAGSQDLAVGWDDIVKFKPDVIILAPRGLEPSETLRYFSSLEKLPGWEDIPAVKRGEVIFSGGAGFYEPTPRIIDAIGILVSAISGLESGYIGKRDTFFRLRWAELNRHKIK